QVRDGRVGQRAARADQELGGVHALLGLDPPPVGAGLPVRAGDRVVEADVPVDVLLLGDPAQVVLDLGLRGEGPRPAGVEPEGERVQVGGDVAGGAGEGVVPPGPADVAGALEEDQALQSGALEPGGHPDAGEPGADDGHPVVRRRLVFGHRERPFGARGAGRAGRGGRGGEGEPGPRDSGAFEPAGPAVRAGRGAARRGQRAIAAGAPGRPSRPARRQTYLAGPASRPALSKVATTLRAAQVLVSMWWWLRRAALAASRGSRPTDL